MNFDNIFFENDNEDVDSIFNSFLNTYLQTFYSRSPPHPPPKKLTK